MLSWKSCFVAGRGGQISAMGCHTGGSQGFAIDSSWVPGSDLGWRTIKVGVIAPAPLTFTSLTHFQGQNLNSMFTIPTTVPTRTPCVLPGLSPAWLPTCCTLSGLLSEGHFSRGFISLLPLPPGSPLCTISLGFPNSELCDTVSPGHSTPGQVSRFHPIYRMRRQFRPDALDCQPGGHNRLYFLFSFSLFSEVLKVISLTSTM